MKNLYLLFFLFFSSQLIAQNYPYCKAGLFSEYTHYSDISIEHDTGLVYGSNLNYQGVPQNLTLDIHYPNLLIDPLPLRPVIVLLHGGGLTGGSKSDLSVYCNKLARAGYVAVSMDYRLGWNQLGAGGTCGGDIQQFRYAVYRALQDAHAGLRFLVHQAANYRIDTGYIFLAGQSEGGMTAMNVAYMNQPEANLLLPGAFADLGPIDSAGNNFFEPFSLKGIFNWCGAIADTGIIQNDTPIPLLSIHGLLDSVMPVELGTYLNCQNANNPYPVMYGPKSIYQRMKNQGICSEANYDANGEHCFFPSLEPNIYIPAKFTCFFKNLLCGNCTTESKVSYNQKNCAEAAPAGVNEQTESMLMALYPNPAKDHLDFTIRLAAACELGIKVMDLTGKTVAELPDVKRPAGNCQLSVPLDLCPGLYIVKLQAGDHTIVRKITIQSF
ncbi:MAG: alpha/beta hydrolase fold domain-containing protein [Chitinophagaceae bacterium]|nr:alpha/beta hydrolase fold domain-containing protein [Chitinophagaceae bacterium]